MSSEILLSNTGITPEAVIDFFFGISSPISQKSVETIRGLPHWEKRRMTRQTLSGVLFWHFYPDDPDHVGQILTNRGKSQRLDNVAKAYLDNFPLLTNKYPDFVTKVRKIGEVLETGLCLPPLLIVAGRIPGSSSLVDGNFRALALMVQSLTDPTGNWEIEAFIGRKFYPLESLLSGRGRK